MKELLKKTYIMNVLDSEIQYEQLSYYDALEFDYLIRSEDFSIVDWFTEFLKWYWFTDKQINNLTVNDMNTFFKTYIDTAVRGFYGKTKENDWKKDYSPNSSYIVFLSQQLHLDPIRLAKEYTPEAINYLLEWVTRNLNEQTKEGRERNKYKSINKQLNDVDKEEELKKIKEMREKSKLLQAKDK